MSLAATLTRLSKHRWLPFFLPVVGTLLFIGVVVAANAVVTSEHHGADDGAAGASGAGTVTSAGARSGASRPGAMPINGPLRPLRTGPLNASPPSGEPQN